MFAIRQKSTGYWMPNYPGRAGGTWMEPKAAAIPRLFHRKQDAQNALDWWLRGEARWEKTSSGPDFDEGWDLMSHKVPGRSADDMEIVAVHVIVDEYGG